MNAHLDAREVPPLAPDDDLVTGSHVHEASIAITCESGTASLRRAGPRGADGRHMITLDAPIDIAVSSWTDDGLGGTSADGRVVTLHIEPAPAADGVLDIDLLFDRSGSMTEWAVGDAEVRGTKFEVARAGLRAVARRFGAAPRVARAAAGGNASRSWNFPES